MSVNVLLPISICIAAVRIGQLHCINHTKIQKCLDVSCTQVHTK
jgi:hypothetical protein